MPDRLTAEEWANWKTHPTTKAFFRYVEDRRQAVMETWAGGAQDEHAQSRCVELTWITGLEFRDIEEFYLDEDRVERDEH